MTAEQLDILMLVRHPAVGPRWQRPMIETEATHIWLPRRDEPQADLWYRPGHFVESISGKIVI